MARRNDTQQGPAPRRRKLLIGGLLTLIYYLGLCLIALAVPCFFVDNAIRVYSGRISPTTAAVLADAGRGNDSSTAIAGSISDPAHGNESHQQLAQEQLLPTAENRNSQGGRVGEILASQSSHEHR